jgi:transcriptional regulator with XRE-family HTH domain
MTAQVFHAERLTLARQWRALNFTALAKKAGLTPQTASAYERSTSTPSPAIVQRVADELEFPVAFFYAETVNEVPEDAARP